jgi:hypothetical protein
MVQKQVRISTYAKMIGKTTQWVRRLIKDGKLKTKVIDNTIFILIE